MAIHVLDKDTVNKIAAGEVIERPMAVVKELIENAIDAGAGTITVEIQDGGKSLIRITDNGSGIVKDDIKLAFAPHATSKIKNLQELLTISTLGFRGEALASIAAVSQLEMLTKTRDALDGYRYVLDGGNEKEFEIAGCPEGTTFIVRNLFFNTPARLKFLKTSQTEAGYINSTIEHMALSRPDISFRFINQNQPKLQTPGNGDMKDTIYSIYGRDIAENLLPALAVKENCEISGFLGKPVITRGNRSYINYFVNGRYIKNNIISRAIEEAYSPYMMNHKYPFTVLHFKIEPGLIDINVHPQKMEVRFANEKELYKDIYNAVSGTLSHREFIPEVTFGESNNKNQGKNHSENLIKKDNADKGIVKNKNIKNSNDTINAIYTTNNTSNDTIDNNINFTDTLNTTDTNAGNSYGKEDISLKPVALRYLTPGEINNLFGIKNHCKNPVPEKDDTAIMHESAAYNAYNIKQENLFETDVLSPQAENDIKIIGQVFSTYWILQYNDNMFLIDQHAAHEKVLYERFLKQVKSNKPLTQMVNPPVILSLSMTEQQALEENMDIFTRLGYCIEHFGGNEYMVNGVPAQLPDVAVQELLIEIIDNLTANKADTSPETLLERIATMSCKAAVKGNNNLPVRQAQELLRELMTLENPYNCPHGRPVMIRVAKRELEKKFKRIT